MEQNDFLKDMFKDSRRRHLISTIIIFFLLLVIAGLSFALYRVSVHCQDQLKEMAIESDKRIIEVLSETEFTTEYQIDTDGQSLNTGNITVNK